MKQLLQRLPVAALLIGMSSGDARSADYPSEQDYFQDLPVVLSASRLSQPISETPNAITVIDREMIVASGARNIADLFKLVPSMYVAYENGHTPIVSYRGITDAYARRMQVLVDGRSIYLPIFGHVDWAELPLDIGDIDRIEVVRGPSAASHGSNSVQGVINISTRHASDARKAEVSTRWGEASVSDLVARFGGAGENWDYRVTLASRGDSGFDPMSDVATIPLNDTSRTQLINTRVNYRPTGSDSLDIQLGYSDSSRQLGDQNPGLNATGIFSTLRDQKVSSDFEQFTWLHTFGGDSDLQVNYYHIGRNTKDERYSRSCATCAFPLNLIASGRYPAFDDAVIHRHDLEMQHTLNISSDNRVVWGMGARHDSANAPNNLRYSPTWREYRLFAHDEWRITPTNLINIGGMAEKNALGQSRVSPRVSYNHHLTPRDTLRASVSVAYRNPEMVEELGNQSVRLNNVAGKQWTWHNVSAAGGLGPEKAISREIGYIGQLDEAGSTLDVRAYHDQISNIIWVDLVADANSIVTPKSFKSDFNAFYSGLEGTLNYNLGARSRLTVNYAHQVTGATPSRVSPVASVNTALIDYANKYSQTVPLNSASLLFSHDFHEGLQFSTGLYHTDPVRSLDAGLMQPLTRYVDFRVAQSFGGWQSKKRGSGGGEIALVVQNALSDHYFDYSTQTRHKRRAYLTATLGY
ncbi:TonB-dependent receptor plug domain-containing protein [Candidatus Ferrigenium straubiae]|jgi:iron complex outermembrane receptor protein|uniref:TonB-dependent receptor plug domain-containing protein n=1 Tax=Candidatus Ferrigenium straubiae TaxID=2919506 RepID=UPI003F4AC52E